MERRTYRRDNGEWGREKTKNQYDDGSSSEREREKNLVSKRSSSSSNIDGVKEKRWNKTKRTRRIESIILSVREKNEQFFNFHAHFSKANQNFGGSFSDICAAQYAAIYFDRFSSHTFMHHNDDDDDDDVDEWVMVAYIRTNDLIFLISQNSNKFFFFIPFIHFFLFFSGIQARNFLCFNDTCFSKPRAYNIFVASRIFS